MGRKKKLRKAVLYLQSLTYTYITSVLTIQSGVYSIHSNFVFNDSIFRSTYSFTRSQRLLWFDASHHRSDFHENPFWSGTTVHLAVIILHKWTIDSLAIVYKQWHFQLSPTRPSESQKIACAYLTYLNNWRNWQVICWCLVMMNLFVLQQQYLVGHVHLGCALPGLQCVSHPETQS